MVSDYYPKKKIAEENEKYLEIWLRDNENILPNTMYGIKKKIKWSYGQTRGTIERLFGKKDVLIKKEVIDERTKKFKTLIALKNQQSHIRLSKIGDNKNLKQIDSLSSQNYSNEVQVLENYVKFLMHFFQKHKEYLQTKIDEQERRMFKEIAGKISR